ncbi:MAG TPA: helix-turn-helix transcriptional regulator [Paludibacteraceae bacterium]|nr:helix-turn-helix transcriptional regulator [Paludibacteraceae bacterium]
METTEKDRIEKVMLVEKLTATQFAAEIGIKTPTLSHILSGRNNPSLDVLKKILERYRTISSDWLILGVGQMYRVSRQSQTPTLFENQEESDSNSERYAQKKVEKNVDDESTIYKKIPVELPVTAIEPSLITEKSKKIKNIIIYYDDSTFQEFVEK